MQLLSEKTPLLLELSLRLSDLRHLFQGKQVGDDQRPHLDLSGLRQHPDDGVSLTLLQHRASAGLT